MEEKLKSVYKEAIEYLKSIKPADLPDERLERYFQVSHIIKTKNEVLRQFFMSLQNYQSMPKIIKFGENESRFKRILCDYDEQKILQKYNSYEELLEVFDEEFGIGNARFSWEKYSKGALSASEFMSQFEDANDFDHFVGLFSYNASTAAALPMLLSREIHGIGFALGCDFLKELGYDQYPKPDVHLMDIFYELGLSKNDQYDCYKAIIRMARASNETPFKVDKVFWLISSGNYHKDGITTQRHKEDFIKYIKSKDII